jgi:hypothetical protein
MIPPQSGVLLNLAELSSQILKQNFYEPMIPPQSGVLLNLAELSSQILKTKYQKFQVRIICILE